MENTLGSANPYTAIVDRNIFNLVPIPTIDPAANAKPPEPPAKITPNGIMTIFGQLQVIFKVATPTKPGAPAQDHSLVMSVGERQDDIEVTKIDEASRTITFNNHGVIQELSLTNATISSPAPPVAGGPALGMIPRPSFGPPPGSPAAAHNFNNRIENHPNAYNPNASAAPSFGGNGFGGNNSQINSQNAQSLSPEAQVIAIEAQRQQWQQQGNPAASLLPPTSITSQLQSESGGGPPVP
jgi:hypothetical protein